MRVGRLVDVQQMHERQSGPVFAQNRRHPLVDLAVFSPLGKNDVLGLLLNGDPLHIALVEGHTLMERS